MPTSFTVALSSPTLTPGMVMCKAPLVSSRALQYLLFDVNSQGTKPSTNLTSPGEAKLIDREKNQGVVP